MKVNQAFPFWGALNRPNSIVSWSLEDAYGLASIYTPAHNMATGVVKLYCVGDIKQIYFLYNIKNCYFLSLGEDFFTDVGYLEAATDIYNDFAAFKSSKEELDKKGFKSLKESGQTIANILPFLNLPKDATVHYQQPINKK